MFLNDCGLKIIHLSPKGGSKLIWCFCFPFFPVYEWGRNDSQPTQTILFLAWLDLDVRSHLRTVSTAMERRRVGAGAGSRFSSFATGCRARGPVRPRCVISIYWAIHQIALCALHSLPKSCTVKPTPGWRGVGASSTSNHVTRSTRMGTGWPITPVSVVTVNCRWK